MAGLLIRVTEREDQSVRPFRAEEAQPHRQALHLAHRHGQVRIAGDRSEAARAAARNLVAIDRVDLPRRGHGRSDQSDDAVVGEQFVDAIGAGSAQAGRAGLEVGGVLEPLGRFGLLEGFLPEQRHFLRCVGAVEGDHVGQAADRDIGRGGGEIVAHSRLQFGEEHGQFVCAHRAIVELVDFDEGCTLSAEHRQSRFERTIGAEARRETHHADALALERIRIEASGIIRTVGVGGACIGIGGVTASDHGQHLGGLSNRAGHRPGGILTAADRDDMSPADQPDGGLIPDDAVDRGGAGDRSVGLRTDGEIDQPGGDRSAAAARRAARVAIKRVGIAGLPADRAPARDRLARADIRPFAEVGLAEDDRARSPQPRDQRCIAAGDVVGQREAAGSGRQRSRDLDIILDQHRLPRQRAGARGAVDRLGLRDRGGIDGEDRMDHRVDRLDPIDRRAGRAFRRTDRNKRRWHIDRGAAPKRQSRDQAGPTHSTHQRSPPIKVSRRVHWQVRVGCATDANIVYRSVRPQRLARSRPSEITR